MHSLEEAKSELISTCLRCRELHRVTANLFEEISRVVQSKINENNPLYPTWARCYDQGNSLLSGVPCSLVVWGFGSADTNALIQGLFTSDMCQPCANMPQNVHMHGLHESDYPPYPCAYITESGEIGPPPVDQWIQINSEQNLSDLVKPDNDTQTIGLYYPDNPVLASGLNVFNFVNSSCGSQFDRRTRLLQLISDQIQPVVLVYLCEKSECGPHADNGDDFYQLEVSTRFAQTRLCLVADKDCDDSFDHSLELVRWDICNLDADQYFQIPGQKLNDCLQQKVEIDNTVASFIRLVEEITKAFSIACDRLVEDGLNMLQSTSRALISTSLGDSLQPSTLNDICNIVDQRLQDFIKQKSIDRCRRVFKKCRHQVFGKHSRANSRNLNCTINDTESRYRFLKFVRCASQEICDRYFQRIYFRDLYDSIRNFTNYLNKLNDKLHDKEIYLLTIHGTIQMIKKDLSYRTLYNRFISEVTPWIEEFQKRPSARRHEFRTFWKVEVPLCDIWNDLVMDVVIDSLSRHVRELKALLFIHNSSQRRDTNADNMERNNLRTQLAELDRSIQNILDNDRS